MTQDIKTFTHHSLQDAKSIKDILRTITSGLGKGKLVLNGDEQDAVELNPGGLMDLTVTASQEMGHSKLSIDISWRDDRDTISKGALSVSTK